mmetsp:Transcript_42945/g.93509  ORF Transcript_42945/g.93509 Transcript_42945/m.93509 type:complete len:200 (-) Transcript_42945:237-836(-)
MPVTMQTPTGTIAFQEKLLSEGWLSGGKGSGGRSTKLASPNANSRIPNARKGKTKPKRLDPPPRLKNSEPTMGPSIMAMPLTASRLPLALLTFSPNRHGRSEKDVVELMAKAIPAIMRMTKAMSVNSSPASKYQHRPKTMLPTPPTTLPSTSTGFTRIITTARMASGVKIRTASSKMLNIQPRTSRFTPFSAASFGKKG